MNAQAQDLVDKVVPAKYHTLAIGVVLAVPYVTRAIHSLMNGGGLRGVWSAIMYGTNVPKQMKVDVQSIKDTVSGNNQGPKPSQPPQS